MSRVAVIILTFNEERHIGACLDSLSGLEAPVFVVDSFSTDQTINILNDRRIAYVQHPFVHYALQRNWAQENCPFGVDWVLHLDAGERATPELVHWLQHRFEPDGHADGVLFSRRTIFMDRWIRHGGHYPSYHLRLFRRAQGRCELKAYDQHFVCSGPVLKAPKSVDMVDHVADNLADFITRHTRWAIMEAVEKVGQPGMSGEVKARFRGTPIERRRWLKNRIFNRAPLFLRAFLYFVYRYFFRLGFLDGSPGLVFHFLQGCWFRFLIDSAVLEIRRRRRKTNKTLEETVIDLYGKSYSLSEKP